jgi:2-polyprenyl-6-methoxyphenol hydroxylase-like FAD-dependent oxidoreductase
VRDLQWSIAVRFERTLVTRFGHQRGWLIGDAAHQAGPVGVHSMNVGLLEGEDLAQRIEQGLRQPSAASLEGFGQHWSAQWRALMGLEGGLVPGESAPAWAIEHRAMLPVTLPASGKDLVALGAQLGLKTG